MITPSSNTVLEPVTARATVTLGDELTVHFTRIEVKTISLRPESTRQFRQERMLDAARLLADANVDVIAWNGTSASWTGFADDENLCAEITRETGAAATSAVLAQIRAMRTFGIRRYSLVVPYVGDVRERIVDNFATIGFPCCESAGLGLTTNADFAGVPLEDVRQMIEQVDRPEAQAIAVVCTNMPAAYVVAEMEQRRGKPVLDSVLVTLWDALRLAGVSRPIQNWGWLLRQSR